MFCLMLLFTAFMLGSCKSETQRYESSKLHKATEKKMAEFNDRWGVFENRMADIPKDGPMDPKLLKELIDEQSRISDILAELESLTADWEVDTSQVPRHQMLVDALEGCSDINTRTLRYLTIEQILQESETELDKNYGELMSVLMEGISVSDSFRQDLEAFSLEYSQVLETMEGPELLILLEQQKFQPQLYQKAMSELESLKTGSKADEDVKEILLSTLACMIQMCGELEPYRKDLIRMADAQTFSEYIEKDKNDIDDGYLEWLTHNKTVVEVEDERQN